MHFCKLPLHFQEIHDQKIHMNALELDHNEFWVMVVLKQNDDKHKLCQMPDQHLKDNIYYFINKLKKKEFIYQHYNEHKLDDLFLIVF